MLNSKLNIVELYNGSATGNGTYTLKDDVSKYKRLHVVTMAYNDQIMTHTVLPTMYDRESNVGVPPFNNTSYYVSARAKFVGTSMVISGFSKSGYSNPYVGRVFGEKL